MTSLEGGCRLTANELRQRKLIDNARELATEIRFMQQEMFVLCQKFNAACTAVVAEGGKPPSFFKPESTI
jgi:hypothetical protein